MKIATALVISAATALLMGCGDSSTPKSFSESQAPDATIHVAEMTAKLKEMAAVLNAVNDEESAKAAVPRITALFKVHDEAGAKYAAAVEAAVAGKAEISSDYPQKEQEWHAAIETFGAAMERVRDLPAAQTHLKPVFDRRAAME